MRYTYHGQLPPWKLVGGTGSSYIDNARVYEYAWDFPEDF